MGYLGGGSESLAVGGHLHTARLTSHCEKVNAGGEHLQLMTVTQNGSMVSSHLYRILPGHQAQAHESPHADNLLAHFKNLRSTARVQHAQTLEPLAHFDNQEAAREGLREWVSYLNDGGTIEEWREHNQAEAFIASHQHWLHRIREHNIEVLGWLRDHPDQEQTATEARRQVLSEWLGAATIEAARNSELLEYAESCSLTAGTLI